MTQSLADHLAECAKGTHMDLIRHLVQVHNATTYGNPDDSRPRFSSVRERNIAVHAEVHVAERLR